MAKSIAFYILSILMVSFFYSSQAKSTEFDTPVLNQNLEQIKTELWKADFIIVGEVLSVGKPDNSQKVTYKILDVVYGRLPKKGMKQITVEHRYYLRSESRLENPDPKKLELSPSLFSPGKRFIVMIEIDMNETGEVDEDLFRSSWKFSTIHYSEQNVKALQQIILDRALGSIESDISGSDFIILGEVLGVGKPPKRYSSDFYGDVYFTYQKVTYKVLDVLKGQVPKKYMNKIAVSYFILGTRLEEPGKPRLSSELFFSGNRFIQLIAIDKKDPANITKSSGIFLATQQNLKAIKQLIKGDLSEEEKISAVRQLTFSW